MSKVIVTLSDGLRYDTDVRSMRYTRSDSTLNERGNTKETISQLQIAPTILKLFDLPIPETMQCPSIS